MNSSRTLGVLVALVLALHAVSLALGLIDHRISILRIVLAITAVVAIALTMSRLPLSEQGAWTVLIVAAYLVTLPLWLALPIAYFHGLAGRSVWRQLALWLGAAALGLSVSFMRKHGFTGSALLAVIQTHASEAGDFALTNLTQRVVAGWIVAALVIAAAWGLDWNAGGGPARRLPASVLAFALLSALMLESVPALRTLSQLLREQSRTLVASKATTPASESDLDVVFILGESTSRWHLGLYGYPYPTTPSIERWRNDVVWLDDAISAHSHTAQSLASLLARTDPQTSLVAESLVGRLRAMGVETHWSSTQTSIGPFDSAVRAVAKTADEIRFFENPGLTLPQGIGRDLGIGQGFTADTIMIDDLVGRLRRRGAAARPGFFVAHLTAAHGDYCRLIPHEARASWEAVDRGTRYFGDARDRSKEVNCYDAAIQHVDTLLGRVIETTHASRRPTVVVFAPDHGEDPVGGSAHSAHAHSARHIEIPVVVFFNPTARARLPQTWTNLQRNRTAPFFLPWLHESILHLFQGDRGATSPSALSIFAAGYQPQERVVFADEGAMNYDAFASGDRKDYLEQTRVNLSSIRRGMPRPRQLLAHRCDSEQTLLEAMQSFDGVEMDIVFDRERGRFDVFHPPKKPGGLSLERALEVVQARPDLSLWLDWKNANAVDVAAAVAELSRLDRRFAIRRRAVVELAPQFVTIEARMLASAGFRHSHYLEPSEQVLAACDQNADEVCKRAVEDEARIVSATGSVCVSYDLKHAAFGRHVARAAGVDCELGWDTNLESTSPRLAKAVRALGHLDMLIVRFPSRYLY